MKLNEFLIQVFGTEKSKNEFEQLKDWKSDGELNAKKLQEMAALNSVADELGSYQSFDVEAALENTMSKIEGDSEMTPSKSNKGLVISAVLLSVLALAIFSYFTFSSSSESINYNVAEGEYEVYTKPDGSQFILNIGTELDADESANSYTLDGEAFFDVEKQNEPVKINTKHGEITVLGTSFNIITTPEMTEIYMFEGTISYKSHIEDAPLQVSKGQCVISNGKKNIIIEDMSEQVFSYWRNHTLKYENTSLTNVLSDLKRLYPKEFDIKSDVFKDIKITSTFVNNTYDEIIDEIQVITGLAL